MPSLYTSSEGGQSYFAYSNSYPLDTLVDLRDPKWDWNEENHFATGDAVVPIVCLLLHCTKEKIMAPRLKSVWLSKCNAYLAANTLDFHQRHLAERVPLLGSGESALNYLSDVTLVSNLQRLEFKYHSREVMPTAEEFRCIHPQQLPWHAQPCDRWLGSILRRC